MNEQEKRELNKRIAERAGFTFVSHSKWSDAVALEAGEAYFVYPDGSTHRKLPNFLSSLDICFNPENGIVRKLAEKGIVVTVGSFEHSGYYGYAYHFLNPEPEMIRAEIPALALCLAVDKLPKEEK